MRQQYWHYYDKMSFYVPTTSMSKFLNSTEHSEESGEFINYVEPLHVSTKYLDFRSSGNLGKYTLKDNHSRINRPAFWDTDLALRWPGRLSSLEVKSGVSLVAEASDNQLSTNRLLFSSSQQLSSLTNFKGTDNGLVSKPKTFLPIKLFLWENVLVYPERF